MEILKATEYEECEALWQWAQLTPVVKDYLFKIVNEGKRSKWYGQQLRNIGLRPGIPDYCLPIPNNNFHALWLEMKTKHLKGSVFAPTQIEWMSKLNHAGYYATFVFGWEDAVRVIKDYLNNLI